MAQNAWTGLAQSTAHLPALGMGMMNMKQEQINRDAALGIARERNEMMKTHYAATEEAAKRQAVAAEAKVEPHKQRMDPSMILQSKVAAKKAYGDEGLKAWQPLYDSIDEVVKANPESTKADAYKAALSAFPAIREQMMESLEKEITSGKLDPIKQKRLEKVYDSIAYDKTGENVLGNGVFSNTARSMKMEEENSKAALQAERIAGQNERAGMTDERIRELHAENLALKRDRENRLGSGGGDEKAKKKEVSDALARINRQIGEYEKEITQFQKEGKEVTKKKSITRADGTKVNYGPEWYSDAIEKRTLELDKAKRTRDWLLNGGDPKEIQWGGGVQQASPKKQIGTKDGKPVYDNGDGTWTVGG